jgi:hypothetical protein
MIPMSLEIFPLETSGRYSWKIVYDTSARNYELVVMDSAKRQFAIDEKNGILLNCFYLGNQLISRFEVQGSLIDVTYTMRSPDEMTMELSAGDFNHHFSTGGIAVENDSIPAIKVYEVKNVQQATLRRRR